MKNISHIKSLDGLRALAVLLVIFDHWSGDRLGFPASYLGVCLFFVLSGFLITGILINSKSKDEELNQSHWKSIKLFFIRRTIRIFPLYYLLLFILFLGNVSVVKENFFWLATYMTNNYIAYKTSWLGNIDHLWSLAVEEQFYIFFPFLIFIFNKKYTKYVLIFLVIMAVGIRAYFYATGDSWIRPYVLMPACLDAFGMGALLAFFRKYQKGILESKLVNFVFITSLILYVFLVLIIKNQKEIHSIYTVVFLRFFESLFSVFLIAVLLIDNNSIVQKIKVSVFENPIFMYIGQISYGIYMIHNLVYNPYHSNNNSQIFKVFGLFDTINPGLSENIFIRIVVVFCITIFLASVSWFMFEKPVNKLKEKFNY